MKIYTKVVINMTSGETIHEESYEYDGPLALCDLGGGSSVQQIQSPQAQQLFEQLTQNPNFANMINTALSPVAVPQAPAVPATPGVPTTTIPTTPGVPTTAIPTAPGVPGLPFSGDFFNQLSPLTAAYTQAADPARQQLQAQLESYGTLGSQMGGVTGQAAAGMGTLEGQIANNALMNTMNFASPFMQTQQGQQFQANLIPNAQQFAANQLGSQQGFAANQMTAQQEGAANMLASQQGFNANMLTSQQQFGANQLNTQQQFAANIAPLGALPGVMGAAAALTPTAVVTQDPMDWGEAATYLGAMGLAGGAFNSFLDPILGGAGSAISDALGGAGSSIANALGLGSGEVLTGPALQTALSTIPEIGMPTITPGMSGALGNIGAEAGLLGGEVLTGPALQTALSTIPEIGMPIAPAILPSAISAVGMGVTPLAAAAPTAASAAGVGAGVGAGAAPAGMGAAAGLAEFAPALTAAQTIAQYAGPIGSLLAIGAGAHGIYRSKMADKTRVTSLEMFEAAAGGKLWPKFGVVSAEAAQAYIDTEFPAGSQEGATYRGDAFSELLGGGGPDIGIEVSDVGGRPIPAVSQLEADFGAGKMSIAELKARFSQLQSEFQSIENYNNPEIGGVSFDEAQRARVSLYGEPFPIYD